MNKYETIIIINPNVEAESVEKITNGVQNLIAENGGEVAKVDSWGKRRLAYEVKGYNDGIYILINFIADPQFVQILARNCELNEQIIKYMTVRAEDLPEPIGKIRAVKEDDEDDEVIKDNEYDDGEVDYDDDEDNEKDDIVGDDGEEDQ